MTSRFPTGSPFAAGRRLAGVTSHAYGESHRWAAEVGVTPMSPLLELDPVEWSAAIECTVQQGIRTTA